ncbi:MAG: hypothetical protein ABEI52_08840 [Halobacteriaceae archaeon]
MNTLEQLGWDASKERTDPPSRDTDVYRPINDGSTGLMIREPDNGAAVIYMENPAEVRP